MRCSVEIGFFVLMVVWMPLNARAAIAITLLPEVRLDAEVIRVEDLCSEEIGPELGAVILYESPRPGHDRRITRGELRRRFVELGVRSVPHLRGSAEVVVRRSGQIVARDILASAVRSAVRGIPLPKGALAQRWDLLSLPKVSTSAKSVDVGVLDPGPLVGRGTVRVRVNGGSVRHRNYFVGVRRALRVVTMRVSQIARVGTDLSAVVAIPDTTWVDRLVDWQEIQRYDEERDGWSLVRPIAPGKRVSRSDLRPTVVVHRGQNVKWTVRRGGVEVRSMVVARTDGAIGEWILVKSAFENRLRRLCVVGPGMVSAEGIARVNNEYSFSSDVTKGAPR